MHIEDSIVFYLILYHLEKLLFYLHNLDIIYPFSPLFYNGKDIPPIAGNDDETAGEGAEKSSQETIIEGQPTKIVVVGTSQILNQVSPAGMAFFQNTLDYLALGGELIGIRSQKLSDRSFQTDPGNTTRFFIKLICIGLVPTLVAIIGAMRFLLKRRARQMVESFGRM